MKKRWKFLIVVSSSLLMLLGGLFYFFYENDAPILHGGLAYNIQYSESQTLDVYYPTKQVYEKSPVLLFVHGGAWIAGRKEAVNFNRFNGAFNRLREKGYVIVSPEYTLARDGKSPFPSCVIDGFDAMKWIAKNADSLRFDLDNLGIMGESAGGHIAMMNTFSNPALFGSTELNNSIDFLVAVYAPNDLWQLYHSSLIDSLDKFVERLPESVQDNFNLPVQLFGFDPQTDSVRARRLADLHSPINFITKENVVPTLVIHGDVDQVVDYDQSKRLTQKLDSIGSIVEFQTLENVDHAFRGVTNEQKDSIQKWITDFVVRQYGSR